MVHKNIISQDKHQINTILL